VRFLLWKMEQAGLVTRVSTGLYALASREVAPPAPSPPVAFTLPPLTTLTEQTPLTPLTPLTVSGVSGPLGGAGEIPDQLAVLAVDIKTANSHEPVPVLASKLPVSVVSGVSSEVEEWIHDRGYTCDTCGGHRGERQPSGRLICLDCLGATA
jgi:hypothetical protein